MFKFLRRYSKYILAVFGTLLLITFLIPFAFTELLPAEGRTGGTWARIGPEHRKVSAAELARVQRELQLLQRAQMLAGVPDLDRPEYWYLLTLEAQNAGFIIAPGSAGSTQEEQLVMMLSASTGESSQFVRETMARLQGVGRMINAYLDTDAYSDRRLKHLARRMFHNVSADVAVIAASKPAAPHEFSEQELADHLAKYADVVPGAGDMGFGYRLPDRVKIEWLAVPADTVSAMVERSEKLNAIELRKHWRRGADEGKFPEPTAGADVPQAVRDDLLKMLTDEELEEIAKFAGDRLRMQRRGLAQRGGYFEITEGWQGLDFRQLALDVQKELGVELPEYHAIGDRWLSLEDVAALSDIGAASTDKFGATPLPLAQLVAATKELGGSPTILIQRGIAGPPLRGADGSVYFFRVTEIDPARPPVSVDEIREQIVADLNRLAHYRELVASADTIRADAAGRGIIAAALAYGTTVEDVPNLSLGFSTNLPKIGDDKAAVATIIDRSLELPQNVPVASLPPSDRILAVPVESKLSLVLAELTQQRPLTEEMYRRFASGGMIQNALLQEELRDGNPIEKAFSYESLAARHQFELASAAAPDAQPPEPG